LLVRNETLGASLASSFAAPENVTIDTANPDRKVALMRRHGFTTQGFDIRTAVFRAVFTTTNARVQTSAFLLRNAFGGVGGQGLDTSVWSELNNDLEPLTAQQAAAAESSNDGTIDRPWGLWEAEVESQPLYKNND
jgi:Class II Aldolase and Adducin N-terminal domain